MTARDKAREDLFAFHKYLYTGSILDAAAIVFRWRLGGLSDLDVSLALEAAAHGHDMDNAVDHRMEQSE